ncbi:MAG: nitrate/nitrite transporter NrtS [Actinobacteria bacterium]|nr:nitrate/nitrite transporter NrtS [Actinomycetota bacterium]
MVGGARSYVAAAQWVANAPAEVLYLCLDLAEQVITVDGKTLPPCPSRRRARGAPAGWHARRDPRRAVPTSDERGTGAMATAPGNHDPSPPTWQRLAETPRCILYRPHLYQTGLTTLVVGTILFAINQLDVVVAGHATTTTWIKIAVTYLVPFCVSNIGLLIGCRRHPAPDRAGPAAGPG